LQSVVGHEKNIYAKREERYSWTLDTKMLSFYIDGIMGLTKTQMKLIGFAF